MHGCRWTASCRKCGSWWSSRSAPPKPRARRLMSTTLTRCAPPSPWGWLWVLLASGAARWAALPLRWLRVCHFDWCALQQMRACRCLRVRACRKELQRSHCVCCTRAARCTECRRHGNTCADNAARCGRLSMPGREANARMRVPDYAQALSCCCSMPGACQPGQRRAARAGAGERAGAARRPRGAHQQRRGQVHGPRGEGRPRRRRGPPRPRARGPPRRRLPGARARGFWLGLWLSACLRAACVPLRSRASLALLSWRVGLPFLDERAEVSGFSWWTYCCLEAGGTACVLWRVPASFQRLCWHR